MPVIFAAAYLLLASDVCAAPRPGQGPPQPNVVRPWQGPPVGGVTIKCRPQASPDPMKGLNVSRPGPRPGGSLCPH
jgi:hypothetical protein